MGVLEITATKCAQNTTHHSLRDCLQICCYCCVFVRLCSLSHTLSGVVYNTYTLCLYSWFIRLFLAFLFLPNFISFCPSIRLNIFHPKCQIKVRIFYRNNNGSASIVRLNNRWKVSMKCGGKGFKKK